MRQVVDHFKPNTALGQIHLYWQSSGPLLAKNLQSILRSTSMEAEAARRMLIDRVIHEANNFLTTLMKTNTLIFPELPLSTGTDSPVTIEHLKGNKEYRTVLTGRVV
ncbi:hypothetical protein AMATHDRAFT_69852 [Amanita thiersii Skay4041]|uniref:Uncharacterized protein n=1 Tax=Amanita thiersii Skay4041 TaxID=703135 RepID=A0A2A9N7K2_9AGAR|nr:hypothetical protein AMATHDRAFT_69852 [Amanita thiersii Skay4041]